MIEELKKSVSGILCERISSPLYGAFILCWLLWNWKIPYATFFESSDMLGSNKIDFISGQLSNLSISVWFPVFSTIIVIVFLPFIANGAFWISMKFDNWKRNKKNEIERKQLLTLEQSIEIREEMQKQSENFAKMLEGKNKEIDLLKATNEALHGNDIMPAVMPVGADYRTDADKYSHDYEEIYNKDIFTSNIMKIAQHIQNDESLKAILPDVISFFIANNIIEKKENSYLYLFTERGRYYLKQYMNSIAV